MQWKPEANGPRWVGVSMFAAAWLMLELFSGQMFHQGEDAVFFSVLNVDCILASAFVLLYCREADFDWFAVAFIAGCALEFRMIAVLFYYGWFFGVLHALSWIGCTTLPAAGGVVFLRRNWVLSLPLLALTAFRMMVLFVN